MILETNFVKFFGRNTRMKLLDFLMENDRTSWNKVEIMGQANVGHTCLLVVIKELLDLKIIKLEKGKYSMNKGSLITKKLYGIYNEINNQVAMKLAEK